MNKKYDILLKNRKNLKIVKVIALSVYLETIPDYIKRYYYVMHSLDHYIEIRPDIINRTNIVSLDKNSIK